MTYTNLPNVHKSILVYDTYFSTRIIVEKKDDLKKIFEKILEVAIDALKNGKYPGSSQKERKRAELELKILLEHNSSLNRRIFVLSRFQKILEKIKTEASRVVQLLLDRVPDTWVPDMSESKKIKERIYIPQIGIDIFVKQRLKNKRILLYFNNDIYEPVFGNPKRLLDEVIKSI